MILDSKILYTIYKNLSIKMLNNGLNIILLHTIILIFGLNMCITFEAKIRF